MTKQSRPLHTASRLGRGLSSLIAPSGLAGPPDVEPALALPAGVAAATADAVAAPIAIQAGTPRDIPVDCIGPNPHQPRKDFDSTELAELAASIRQQGVLQPLLVARAAADVDRPYILIAGERRLRAARLAGLASVPCIIRDATDQQLLEWSLIENIQRANLNPIERAQAYRSYMDRFALTQAEVADRTGEARATVANYLRMLDLCDQVQAMLLDGRLTFGHAKALAGLAGQPGRQLGLAERIVRQGLSVRHAERLVGAEHEAPSASTAPRPRRAKPPYIADLESQLTRAVGTRVTIIPGRARHTGRLLIDYYSLDDFDRIVGALGLRPEA